MFDFETFVDRKGKDARAFDELETLLGKDTPKTLPGFSQIPMWIADMNFATCPSIVEAIEGRLDHPLFGYFTPRPEYYEAISNWQKNSFGISDLAQDKIEPEVNVLGGITSALRVTSPVGSKILLHALTYIGFTKTLFNNGYRPVLSYLKKDDDGVWRMDFDDMEQLIVQNNIHTCIFCSPHNPSGRVWESSELERAMHIFKKHDVVVLSDEIWSDLVLSEAKHIPLYTINEDAKNRVCSFYSLSKTFNCAGLSSAYSVIYNKSLRDRVNQQASLSHYNALNICSMYATIGAYCDMGKTWLSELISVLEQNAKYAVDFVNSHLDGAKCSKIDGTYMLFVECCEWCEKNNMCVTDLLKRCYEVGVFCQNGEPFHGKHCIRFNLALPFSVMKEAFSRLEKYVFN